LDLSVTERLTTILKMWQNTLVYNRGTMNEQRYQDILAPLQKGKQYTLAELSSVIHTLRPQLSPRGYSWILSHLVQQGSLKRIKEGIYLRDDTLKIYDSGSLPKVGQECISLIRKAYPDFRIVAFETTILNEWLNELIARSTLIIEVESLALGYVYNALHGKVKATLLLKPSAKEMDYYRDDRTVLLEPLVSRAPLTKNQTTVRLEKLMVDLIADDFLSFFYSSSELPDMFESMRENYAMDYGTLFNYAKRRRVSTELSALFSPI
jgi:hypothetical protein